MDMYVRDMIEQQIFSEAELEALCAEMALGYDVEDIPAMDIPRISMAAAQGLIVSALEEYSPNAAQMAARFFDDPSRLILSHQPYMMCCHPAGTNDNETAHIEINYDGSVKSAIILAHEMGHALADDFGHLAGHSIMENPLHMQETQAYVLQHIMTRYLQHHSHQGIAAAARKQSWDGAAAMDAIVKASKVAREAKLLDDLEHEVDADKLMRAHFGENWYDIMLDEGGNLHRARVMKRVYQAVLDVNDEALPTEDRRMKKHMIEDIVMSPMDRPAAYYLAYALVTRMEGMDVHARTALMADILGADGPMGARDILPKVALKDPENLIMAARGFVKTGSGSAVQAFQPAHL